MQIVVRIKLGRAHKMFGTGPSMSVPKVGTSVIVLAPALPLTCCVILGKCLPLSAPEALHASSSLGVITKKPELEKKEKERSQRWKKKKPEMLGKEGLREKQWPVFPLRIAFCL